MLDRKLGYLYSRKSRLVNPDGEKTAEFGVGAGIYNDDVSALSGSQKGRKLKRKADHIIKEDAFMAGMEICATGVRDGMKHVATSIGKLGYSLSVEPSQIDLWRSTVIGQIEERLATATRKRDKKRVERLEKLLRQKEEEMFVAADEECGRKGTESDEEDEE